MFKLKLSNRTVKAGAVVTVVLQEANGSVEVVVSLKSKLPTEPTGNNFPDVPAVESPMIEINGTVNVKFIAPVPA